MRHRLPTAAATSAVPTVADPPPLVVRRASGMWMDSAALMTRLVVILVLLMSQSTMKVGRVFRCLDLELSLVVTVLYKMIKGRNMDVFNHIVIN